MTGARIGDIGQVPPRSLEFAVNDADIGEPRCQREQPERTEHIGNAMGFSEIAGRDSARAIDKINDNIGRLAVAIEKIGEKE
jgi:hypothetical protein